MGIKWYSLKYIMFCIHSNLKHQDITRLANITWQFRFKICFLILGLKYGFIGQCIIVGLYRAMYCRLIGPHNFVPVMTARWQQDSYFNRTETRPSRKWLPYKVYTFTKMSSVIRVTFVFIMSRSSQSKTLSLSLVSLF